MIYLQGQFDVIRRDLHHKLINEAPQVNTGHWQGVEGTPHAQTRELSYVTLEMPIADNMGTAQWVCDPNLPWAEDHFQERVAGDPTNPGDQYMNWPWYRGGVESHKEQGKFSHTYQERMWPRRAGNVEALDEDQQWSSHEGFERMGIRFRYGDLTDLLRVLAAHPTTRQAYLPMWFPEDLAAATEGERVPCSLGWHFMVRDGKLNVAYYMRSVDFVRYFRDDVYMTMRLAQWIVEKLKSQPIAALPGGWSGDARDSDWYGVVTGTLHMHISSLHIFEGDMGKMIREAPERP